MEFTFSLVWKTPFLRQKVPCKEPSLYKGAFVGTRQGMFVLFQCN